MSEASHLLPPPRAFDLALARHELRTPINHILGYCEMLLEEPALPPPFRADLERIHTGGRDLLALVTRYFDETQFEEARRDLTQLYHDLRTPVNHIVGYTELLQDLAADSDQRHLLSDLQRIHQAATTWLTRAEAYLLSAAPEEPRTPTPPAPQPAAGHALPVRALDEGRILVADDDSLSRAMLVRRLQRHGYQVAEAESGAQALDRLRGGSYDLLLLDLLMPGLDGCQVLARLKADPAHRDLPVIMLSALDQEEGIVRCIELGAEDYLAKPFNPVFLRARIGACLEKKRLRDKERRTHEALQASQRRLAAELAEAATYVRTLLPAPLAGPIRTDWCFHPSEQLGGDAFGYHWLDEERFALYLLDVSGHGVGAALLSVSVMNVLRAPHLPGVDLADPGSVLCWLNRTFRAEEHNYLFFTLWYGVYRRTTGELTYASGGHPPALLFPARIGKASPPERLATAGPAIGCQDRAHYPSATCLVPPGSTLLLFSDGAYEIDRPDGSMWDLEGLVGALTAADGTAPGQPEALLQRVQALHGSPALQDDFSVLEVQFPAEGTGADRGNAPA